MDNGNCDFNKNDKNALKMFELQIGNFGIFGTIVATINHYNRIYILCADGTFVTLEVGDKCTFIRLRAAPSSWNAYLFSK